MGVVRAAYLIDENGIIVYTNYNVKVAEDAAEEKHVSVCEVKDNKAIISIDAVYAYRNLYSLWKA